MTRTLMQKVRLRIRSQIKSRLQVDIQAPRKFTFPIKPTGPAVTRRYWRIFYTFYTPTDLTAKITHYAFLHMAELSDFLFIPDMRQGSRKKQPMHRCNEHCHTIKPYTRTYALARSTICEFLTRGNNILP